MPFTSSKPIVFSVITVCYNAEETISRTLKSVSGQSYQHIEYIVIDGASKDRTLELVAELSPEAKVFSEPDKGIYDAMNKGLDRATGDYICFMNAGDTFASEHTLRNIVRDLRSEGDGLPDVIYGDTEIVNERGESLGRRRLRPPKHLTEHSFKNGMLVCHQSFYPHRTLCPRYDLTYRFSADVDWCIRILKESHWNYFTHTTLSKYLNEGMTTANHKESLIERFKIMVKHYGIVSTVLHHIFFLLFPKR